MWSIVNWFDIKICLRSIVDYIFFQLKENNQSSKFVLCFQAQFYTENSWDKYLIMIYISLVIYVTLAIMAEQGNVS